MTGARPAVEIAVQDAAGTAAALGARADRVELCSALVTGGLTPSIGSVLESVATAAALGSVGAVHVLVRARPGGFVYSADERSTMVRDVRALRGLGIGGVVVGALTAERRIDETTVRALIDAAEGLPVTFHRAIDVAAEPVASVEQLVGLGISRVLSSGGAVRSADGRDTLLAMHARAGGRLEVMAGGGIGIDDIPGLLGAGLDAVHLSARRSIAEPHPSGPGGGAVAVERTDPAIVAGAVAARDLACAVRRDASGADGRDRTIGVRPGR